MLQDGKVCDWLGPWLGVQISNQSALNLMRVHPDSSFCISMQKWEHLSNYRVLTLFTFFFWPTIWKLYVSLWKRNMSMVMMEYISGIWSIIDNCYECRVILSMDIRILYKGSHKNIGLIYYTFWFGWSANIMSLKWTCCLLSSHTYSYNLNSIYQVTRINWDTMDYTLHYTVSLGLDRHTYNLIKRFCGPRLSQNLQFQEKLLWRFTELPSKERTIYKVTQWLTKNFIPFKNQTCEI